jgi:hypothetical protein
MQQNKKKNAVPVAMQRIGRKEKKKVASRARFVLLCRKHQFNSSFPYLNQQSLLHNF